MSAFRGMDRENPEIGAEISGIELALEETGRSAAKIRDIFTMGKDKLFYRFSLCIFLQFLQQMCGSNLISTYSTVSQLIPLPDPQEIKLMLATRLSSNKVLAWTVRLREPFLVGL